MDDQQHKALLQGLKACETNYRYSISKHGNVSEHELSLWEKQLDDLSAAQITRGFKLHLQNSSFFPTVADIRNAPGLWHEAARKTADRWDQKQLPAPESGPKEIPEKAKQRLKALIEAALEDPKTKKEWERKQRATDENAYRQPKTRNPDFKLRHDKLTEDDLKEIYYRQF